LPVDDQIGQFPYEERGDRSRVRLRRLEVRSTVQRHEHVDALRSRHLRERLEALRRERFVQAYRHTARVTDARGLARVEVEDLPRRLVGRVDGERERVDLDGSEVHEPQQRRQVVDHAVPVLPTVLRRVAVLIDP
jgi:hypothetical protein